MKFKNLSIIGAGPNCTYALEILLKKTLQEKIKKKRLIKIFEPTGLLGCGKTHSKFLNQEILLNRVAGQISLGSYPFNKFPNFLKKYDYNFMEWKKKSLDKSIKNIKSTDWPPRYIFGLALEQKFIDIFKLFRKYTNTKIEIYHSKIISIKKTKQLELIDDKDQKHICDKVLVTTGNYIPSNKNTKLNRKILKIVKNTNCNFEYNFLNFLDNKDYWKKFKNKKIIIFGTGVSSIDVISMINSKCKKIYPISRTFLFPLARPLNQKLSDPKKYEHSGIILNSKIIKFLQNKVNKEVVSNEITIKNSILPLIKSEFYLIYFKSFLRINEYMKFKTKLINLFSVKNFLKSNNFRNADIYVENYLKQMIQKKNLKKKFFKKNWFSQKKILENISNNNYTFFDFFSNPLLLEKKTFEREYINFLKWDINEAKKGNLSSPFKKASDGVFRDLRPLMTILFDDIKNQKIYKEFLNKILPIHNRLADGPSLDMIKKIKKLILKKKIIMKFKNNYNFKKMKKTLFLSNNIIKIKIDYIFSAVADIYKTNFFGDKLYNNMKKNFILSFNKNIGIKLSKNQSPLNKNNFENKNITFIGPASEGSKFFHHTLSRPDKKQFNIEDLEKWVARV